MLWKSVYKSQPKHGEVVALFWILGSKTIVKIGKWVEDGAYSHFVIKDNNTNYRPFAKETFWCRLPKLPAHSVVGTNRINHD